MDATYWSEPTLPFDERRRLYLEYCAAQTPGGRTGFFSQIARLELGRGPLDEALDWIDRREDCSDSAIGGLLRILYKYRASPLISYCQAEFGDIKPTITRAGESHALDFTGAELA